MSSEPDEKCHHIGAYWMPVKWETEAISGTVYDRFATRENTQVTKAICTSCKEVFNILASKNL